MKKFLLYLFRWQCSTPILWVVLYYTLEHLPTFTLVGITIDSKLSGTILANLIGGCMFFFVDRWIFSRKGTA